MYLTMETWVWVLALSLSNNMTEDNCFGHSRPWLPSLKVELRTEALLVTGIPGGSLKPQ